MSSRWVVFYDSAPDVLPRSGPHMAAHSAHIDEVVARGEVLAVGTFEDPQANGAMSILTSREAAVAYAEGDPFVVHGLVSYRILEWEDLLDDGAG